ncbi:hypothetical protein GCM10007036_13930 [Alsobacter metallidurans]|uniref:Uncharacterized protein n=1 Tax=Alsobacter metallidurans TaxID=340221 RepID=A0A917I5W1_9HYPH|nr:hypothetical protein [Alsobacter metallidurans]GGH14541.1 hypothetical protein GCM10007036_13930 [Alsobacter metallidurans]
MSFQPLDIRQPLKKAQTNLRASLGRRPLDGVRFAPVSRGSRRVLLRISPSTADLLGLRTGSRVRVHAGRGLDFGKLLLVSTESVADLEVKCWGASKDLLLNLPCDTLDIVAPAVTVRAEYEITEAGLVVIIPAELRQGGRVAA